MKRLFLNERLMLAVVILNAMVIFLQECGLDWHLLVLLDAVGTLLFLAEMLVKQAHSGMRAYWRNGWNAFAGAVTLLSLPSLVLLLFPSTGVNIAVIQALRMLRLLKLLRTGRYFHNLGAILNGFRLALKQSLAIILAFLVLLVIVAMLNCLFFRGVAPDYFGTPLDAIYSMFRLFTVEGWYDIPDAITANVSRVWAHVVRLYFSLLLFAGGVIGMSLINSIFVDAMVADNNDDIKEQLRRIEDKLDRLERR